MIRIPDDRLPELVEIEEPNRQQSRRITRRQTPCAKCRRPLTADDLCFANGSDAHRSCAEMWNYSLFDGWDTLREQDQAAAIAEELEAAQIERSARSMGLALPKTQQESGLWTPPNKTPAAVATA